MLLKVLMILLCLVVGAMMGGGFARARGNDIRATPKPHPYFPFHDMLILGNRESGKTTILLWILMFVFTEALLRRFYTEVIIICAKLAPGQTRAQSSDWSLFRHLF